MSTSKSHRRVKSLVREWDHHLSPTSAAAVTTTVNEHGEIQHRPRTHSASEGAADTTLTAPATPSNGNDGDHHHHADVNEQSSTANGTAMTTSSTTSRAANHARKRSKDLAPLSIPDSPKRASFHSSSSSSTITTLQQQQQQKQLGHPNYPPYHHPHHQQRRSVSIQHVNPSSSSNMGNNNLRPASFYQEPQYAPPPPPNSFPTPTSTSPTLSPSPALSSANRYDPFDFNNLQGPPPPPSRPPCDQEIEEDQDVFLPLSPNSHSVVFPTNNIPIANGTDTAATTRHSRRHSRVHSRNLSVYFPRPEDQSLSPPSPQYLNFVSPQQQVSDIPPAPAPPYPSTRNLRPSFTPGAGPDANHTNPSGHSRTSKRAGHHHRHSISYSGFSFLDPQTQALGTKPSPIQSNGIPINSATTATTATTSSTTANSLFDNQSSSAATSPQFSATPITVASTLSLARAPNSLPPATSLYQKYSHYSSLVRFCVGVAYVSPNAKLALLLSFTQIFLGVCLWISGQAADSLSVTALGYWVVFDGIAASCAVIVEGRAGGVDSVSDALYAKSASVWNSPFGPHRRTTLAHFSQCIFLLFSGIYVLKEATEHALLLHDVSHHQVEHDSHHAPAATSYSSFDNINNHDADHDPTTGVISIPNMQILLSMLVCAVAAVFVHNHSTLTYAIGESAFAKLRPPSSSSSSSKRSASPLELLGNPFSLTIISFGGVLMVLSLIVPETQFVSLDKLMAFMQSAMMFYVGYPAASITGKVLLQTAPPLHSDTMESFNKSLQDLETHPLVVEVLPPQVWQLTPHSYAKGIGRNSRMSNNRNQNVLARSASPQDPALFATTSQNEESILVATLTVFVRADASDQDIVQVTRDARDMCSPSVEGNKGQRGELTIQVKRAATNDYYKHSNSDDQLNQNNDDQIAAAQTPNHKRTSIAIISPEEDADHDHHDHHDHHHNNDDDEFYSPEKPFGLMLQDTKDQNRRPSDGLSSPYHSPSTSPTHSSSSPYNTSSKNRYFSPTTNHSSLTSPNGHQHLQLPPSPTTHLSPTSKRNSQLLSPQI